MFKFYLALLLTLCAAAPAEAALFCVEVQGISPQCLYDDPRECRARANQLGGICGLNPSEATLQPGFGKFCLVDASRASQCVYPDRNTCETEAARNRAAVCIENTAIGEQPNPYRYVPNRPY